jgi:hypothetical protein
VVEDEFLLPGRGQARETGKDLGHNRRPDNFRMDDAARSGFCVPARDGAAAGDGEIEPVQGRLGLKHLAKQVLPQRIGIHRRRADVEQRSVHIKEGSADFHTAVSQNRG